MEKMLAVACNSPLKKWPVCIKLHRLTFVIMVVIFCVLSASQGVLSNQRDDFVQNSSIPSTYLLPGDTPTESHIVSKNLTDTKSSSTTGTTSTVRPWPSHNFFRTVLSKSDNVPNKENRPNLTRRSQDETGGTNSYNPLAHLQNENAPLTSESLVRKRQKGKYKINRKRKHKGVTLVTQSKSVNNETNINTQPKAFSGKSKEEESITPQQDVGRKAKNRGKVQSQRTFLISSEREVEETTSSQQRNDTGTVYQFKNPIRESWHNESSKSFINSPNVGFQYEIIIPPPTTPSSIHGSSTDTVSTSFPSTTIPNNDMKYVTNEKYESATLAVAIKTTEISYATSTTPSMKTQASENEIKENLDVLAISTSTETNKDVDGQTSQNFLPPTHASQLNMHFQDSYNMSKHGSSGSSVGSTNGTRILQKNHLPVSGIAYPQDSNKAHTEIKPNNNDLSPTINHIPSTTLPASTTSIRTSTFLPIVKKDGERNSSGNTFTTFSTVPAIITHPYRQPTQNTHYIPSLEMQQNKIPQDFTFDIEGGGTGSNQSFHRPISPKYHITIEAPGKIDRNLAIPTNDVHLRQTAIIRKRNMFTVINKVTPNPKIHVENLGNLTTKIKATRKRAKKRKPSLSLAAVHDMKLHTQINQLERPTALPSASYLTGPDRTVKLESVGSDNDYFDEDDAQANLHHWIESSQGHSVGSSTELPRFTNLTWPYYITSPENNTSFNGSLTGNGGTNASTAIAVSFTSQRDQKVPDFDSQYEFYIPAAAANPLQKPILISKKRNNKTAEATLESWTRVPTLSSHVDTMKGQGESNMYHLKQSDHKSKIKHSHWGSNGLNIKIKAQKVKSFSQQLKQKQHHTTKVYESSTGKPKSTTSVFFPSDSHQTPFTFSTFKHQKHFLTSPSSLSAWPFAGAPGQTEIASFVTAKTPTNIWYKPIINHFTASQPVSGTYSYETDNKVINRVTSTASTTTTKQPPAIEAPNVGGHNAPAVANPKDKTFQGESNSNSGIGENDGNTKSPILFNVWNLGTNGKLKLQNQKKIPAWALQGYIIPASGSILNLQQIPAALQPLVTSAMNKEVEESDVDNNKPPHVWHPLPLFVSTPTIISTTSPMTIENIPDEFLSHEEESNRRKVVTSQTVSTSTMGWSKEKDVVENASNKAPISINYVLWNNPSTIYGQSIILSTPNPQLLSPERNHPTLMPHFPQSPITPEASITQSAAHLMTMQPETSTTATTTRTPAPSTSTTTMSNEKLELIFQNYFQYYTTPKSSTTTLPPVTYEKDPHKLYNETSDTNAWNDLKKLILRLAASGNKSDKTSVALDKEDPENLELLENVAAIALIMSYLRNRYESTHTESPLTTLTTTPAYGVTDDMTPPHKDPLWATVYPLFQHFLNNPNFTFVPPPPPLQLSPQSTPQPQPSEFSEFISSITPTTASLVTSTEPMMPDFIKLNHFVSYYPSIPESPTTPSQIPISITEIPKHGATTQDNPHFEEELDELEDLDKDITDKMKTLLLIHKLKKKKKKLKKLKRKKKDKLESALLGAALLHKISKPFMHVVKAPSKYWLDLKFDIDFYDIVKKKLLYFLAYRYMPVFMVLAFGLIPITLSFVPLLYKMWWSRKFKWPRWPKHKYIHVPYPKPYPVPVHHHHLPPSHHSSYDNHGDHIFQGHHEQSIHVDSPTFYDHEHHDQDHFYAAATTGSDPNEKKVVHPGLNKRPPHPLRGNRYRKGVNSFNYAESRHTSSPASPPQGAHNMSPEEDQQIHVHIHDDETNNHPQFHPPPPPITNRPISYTSYTKKDLLPYPSTASYGIGFDIGQTLAGMTNKHDMEILKILVESKKEKINKLLEMWKLAKYGVNVAKNAAAGRTTSHSDNDHGERQRKRRRKKRMS